MPGTSPVIETSSLSKAFGSAVAVRDLDLEVEPGQVFGFLGPNGAGKTTTIRILLNLQRATSGRALLFGLDSQEDSVRILRRVGYIPGEISFFPRMTGWDHVNWFHSVRGSQTPKHALQLSKRLDVDLNRRVTDLSKGNRQKIGIILAFFHQPELLILDEPTSGLDPLVADEFEALLEETVSEGRTVFLSTHNLDEVQRIAHRVAIIKDGRLVMSDTVENLRRSVPEKLEFRFHAPVDPKPLLLNGVRLASSNGTHVSLELTGPIAPVLAAAAELDPTDVVARHANLDELFLAVYRGDEGANEGHRST